MKKCLICSTNLNSIRYEICYKCFAKLKQEAEEETLIEFEKQYKITNIEEQSEIFKHSNWEVEHNSYYDNLTNEQRKEKIYKQFKKDYLNRLLYCKINNLKNNKNETPNNLNWDLWYPSKKK